jgi:hypothetical protein
MLSQMTDNAPASIKADVAILAAAYGKYLDALAKYDYDYNKLIAAAATDTALNDAIDGLSSSAVRAANKNVGSYYAKTCGASTVTT